MADSSSPEKPCACIDLTVTPQSEVEDSADKGADKGPAAEEIVLKLESNEIENESKVPTTNGHGKRRREDKGDDKRPLKLPVGLGSAGRSAAAPVGIRTAETLAQEYDKNNETGLLPTIPGGPWQGADAVDATTILKKEIKRWANDLHTGGGATLPVMRMRMRKEWMRKTLKNVILARDQAILFSSGEDDQRQVDTLLHLKVEARLQALAIGAGGVQPDRNMS